MAPAENLFDRFLNAEHLFVNRDALTDQFLPDHLPHRDRETEEIARIVAPCLGGQKPSNAVIFGYPGTGKTAVTQLVLDRLRREAQRVHVPVGVLYVNCNMKGVADTEYRVIREFVLSLGGQVPHRGFSKAELYEQFVRLLEKRRQHVIIVFDEIDKLLFHSGSQFLYTFTRINPTLSNATVSFIGITNQIALMNDLDGRIRSSLSQQQVVFPPYNAVQLATILSDRVHLAFRPGVVEPGTIGKCAALGAQDHGDARRSLDLLRVAGQIAEWEGVARISAEHVDQADARISRDTTLELIRAQPQQHAAVLYAILSLGSAGSEPIQTGNVFARYVDLSQELQLRVLTAERVSNIIAELDTVGLIHSHVVSRGRFGRSREITVPVAGEEREHMERELRLLLDR